MSRHKLHPSTAIINKAQRNKSKQARNDALDWLVTAFPEAFDTTQCIRPLKIGIMDDILAHADKAEEAGISKSKLREAVVLFSRRIAYLACLKAREMRIDLEGNPTTQVSAEDAEKAILKMKKRIEKSARNARKLQPPKTSIMPNNHRQGQSGIASYIPSYPERAPAFSAQNPITPPKAATVIVKHKTSRQFDPGAVARLREKLGLTPEKQPELEEV